MPIASSSNALPVVRPSGLATACLLGLVALLTACVQGSPTSPVTAGGPNPITAPAPARLPAGAFYLRSMDGQSLPVALADGSRIESGFVVADSAGTQLVGWGESIARNHTGSVRLATGTARVLGQDASSATVASIAWQNSGGAADSVRWTADSVVVHRTGHGPSLAGAGHRLVYTRATPADTL